MDSISELLAYIVAILFFGLPLITWFLFSAFGRMRRQKRLDAQQPPPPPSPTRSEQQQPTPIAPENWLYRIKGGVGETASTEAEVGEAGVLAGFDGLGDEFDRRTLIDHGMGGEEAGGYEDIPAEGLSGKLGAELGAELGLVRSSSPGLRRRAVRPRSRLERLTALQRAVVMAEILGSPVGIRAGGFGDPFADREAAGGPGGVENPDSRGDSGGESDRGSGAEPRGDAGRDSGRVEP
jgi:hypothetical protein